MTNKIISTLTIYIFSSIVPYVLNCFHSYEKLFYLKITNCSLLIFRYDLQTFLWFSPNTILRIASSTFRNSILWSTTNWRWSSNPRPRTRFAGDMTWRLISYFFCSISLSWKWNEFFVEYFFLKNEMSFFLLNIFSWKMKWVDSTRHT